MQVYKSKFWPQGALECTKSYSELWWYVHNSNIEQIKLIQRWCTFTSRNYVENRVFWKFPWMEMPKNRIKIEDIHFLFLGNWKASKNVSRIILVGPILLFRTNAIDFSNFSAKIDDTAIAKIQKISENENRDLSVLRVCNCECGQYSWFKHVFRVF